MPVAATVYISESNGAGEVVTDNISNINFGSVDQPNMVAASHPVIIGENSYFKMLRFRVASLGDSTTVKDLRYWKSAGALVTDEILSVADGLTRLTHPGTTTPITYLQPNSNNGADPPFNPVGLYNSNNFIRTTDPGTAQVSIGGALAGTLMAPGYSDYFVMQIGSLVTTPVGPANTKTLTFQFDET